MLHAPFLGIAPRPSPGGPGGERKARRTGRRGNAGSVTWLAPPGKVSLADSASESASHSVGAPDGGKSGARALSIATVRTTSGIIPPLRQLRYPDGQVRSPWPDCCPKPPWLAPGGKMPNAPIRFGTDGWRGRIGEDSPFAAVRRCADGFAAFLRQSAVGEGPVVVGYDRRFASEHFAEAVAEVLAGNGLRVLLTNTATPPGPAGDRARHSGRRLPGPPDGPGLGCGRREGRDLRSGSGLSGAARAP